MALSTHLRCVHVATRWVFDVRAGVCHHREVGLVFGRRQAKTHGRLMREELNESVEHLRMAAAHAAGGAAEVLAPRLDAARDRVEPNLSRSVDWVVVTAGDAARQGKKAARRAAQGNVRKAAQGNARKATKGKRKGDSMARKRMPMLVGGLLVAGAIAGIAGALMSRRRQQKWQEYGASEPISGIKQEAKSMVDSATKAGAESVAKAADTVKEKATEVARSATSSTSTSPTESARSTDFGQTSDPFTRAGSGATVSRNSRP